MKPLYDMVVFDLDGTIADTFPDVSQSINHAVEKMGIEPLGNDALKKAIGPGGDEFIRAVLPEERLHEKHEFLSHFRAFYDQHCLDMTRPFPGIPGVLSSLSSCRLAVATNKPARHARMILEGLNLLGYFSALCTPDNGVSAKPDPEMIVAVMERFGTEPGRTLLVGDTERDIRAGREAGAAVCGVTYGYGKSQRLENLYPDFLIDSPVKLLDIVLHSSN